MAEHMHKQQFIYSEHTGEYVEIQGLRVHVMAAGDGDPVLLIHGVGQSAYTWRRSFDELSKHFLVIAVDMIGYGYSDKPDLTYSIEENSEFLLALLNTLRIKQTHLVAIGSGAVYALDFVIHYPARVGRAVCLAPGGVTPDMPAILRTMASPTFSRAASWLFTEGQVRRILRSCMFDQTCLDERDMDEIYETLALPGSKEVLCRSLKNFHEEEVVSRLRMVPHEVLYCWGSEDRWRPLEEQNPYVTATPESSLYIMRNCGHLAHEEKPERFNEVVTSFLDDGLVPNEA